MTRSSSTSSLGKFAVAIRGAAWAIRTQSSCWIHLLVAVAVIIIATYLQIEPWRWAVLVLAIGLVISVELVNTAFEVLVRGVHPQHDEQVGRALDIAAGAVLVAAITAVAVGLITLGPPLWNLVAA